MITFLKNHRLLKLIAILILVVFIVAMFVPVKYIPVDTQYDKLQHAGFFILITLSFYICISQKLWKVALAATAIAMLSELIQIVLPYRSGSMDDLWADFIGIGLASTAILIFVLIKRGLKP